MKTFLSGKANKVAALFLFFFLPRIIADTFFEYDYEISSIIGIIFIVMFMFYVNKPSIANQKSYIQKSKSIILLSFVILAVTLQLLFFYISYKRRLLTAYSNWLTYKHIIDAIILAPISEELFFRWSLVETCISKDTKTYKKIIFLVLTLIVWNYGHGSITDINTTVILLGCMLYAIYFKSRNLLYCIVFHMTLNLTYLIGSSPLQNKLIFLFDSNLFIVVDILLIILSFYMTIKKISEVKKQELNLQ